MKKIIGKLLEIEASLRSIREELLLYGIEDDHKDLSDIDFGTLAEITPDSWKQWFAAPVFTTPTDVWRYRDILPDLLVGAPTDDVPIASFEQRPFVAADGAVRHSLNLSLLTPVAWFTIEMRVPPALVTGTQSLYLSWTSTVNVSQKIQVNLYRRDTHGVETVTPLGDFMQPSTRWSEIKLANPDFRADLVDAKFFFVLPPQLFHSISFEDFRLYTNAPADAVVMPPLTPPPER